MRCLHRNKRTFYYLPYTGMRVVTDSAGNEIGRVPAYGEPVRVRANVASASGVTQTEMYGGMDAYDRIIVMEDANCPINEQSVLFIDKEPEFDNDGNPKYDYVVKRVSRSLNVASYVVSKVVV